MRNRIVSILLSLFFCSTNIRAQQTDSLIKILPQLKDSAKVECLNSLCVQYIYKHNQDSSSFYANLAYDLSKKINYRNGIAEYFAHLSAFANVFDHDLIKAEKLARESLMNFDLSPNKTRIEVSYWQVGNALFQRSFHDSAEIFLQLSHHWAERNKNYFWISTVLGYRYENYRDVGEYEKAFEAFQDIQEWNFKVNKKEDSEFENYALAELNRRIGNYAIALNYYRKLIKEINLNNDNIWYRVSYPELFALNSQFDSAQYYYDLIDTLKCSIHELRFYQVSKGEFYLLQNKYREALWFLLKGLKNHRDAQDFIQVNRALLDIAKVYTALADDKKSLVFTREALNLALRSGSKQFIRDAYQILYGIYERKQQPDSAFFYYRKYVTQNELVANDNVKGKFAAYNYEQKIKLLDKEKQIQSISLSKESGIRKLLTGGILVIVLLAFIVFRNIVLKRRSERKMLEYKLEMQKFESEKSEAALQQQATELETQSLRSQMNPHFIFNSLNSINGFILKNDRDQASGHLTKFSRLIRLILQNSRSSLISLESELESLRLYLELEAIRFSNHFDFKISIDDSVDIFALKVPPMIIQPYAENAIWHGLMAKEENGLLEIKLHQVDDILFCHILDNGIGRNKSRELKSKSASTHQSMGMKITAARIAMLNKNKQFKNQIVITDLVLQDGIAAGTEVIIKIQVSYD